MRRHRLIASRILAELLLNVSILNLAIPCYNAAHSQAARPCEE